MELWIILWAIIGGLMLMAGIGDALDSKKSKDQKQLGWVMAIAGLLLPLTAIIMLIWFIIYITASSLNVK